MENENNKQSAKLDVKDLNKLAFSTLSKELELPKIKKEFNKVYEPPQSTIHELFDLPKLKDEKKEESNSFDEIIELANDEKKLDIDNIKKIDYEIPLSNSFQAKPMDVDMVDKTMAIPVVNEEQQEQVVIKTDLKETKVVNDDTNEVNKYIEDFIGNNYKKINKKIINFSAFFFGSFYYLYRKLYLIGILSLLINLVILYFIKNLKFLLIIEVAFRLMLGILFNIVYILFSKKKIKKIIKKTDEEHVKETCVLSGGTDLLVSSLVIVGYLILIILFFSSNIFSLFSKYINFDKIFKISEKDELGYNASNFGNMVESYTVTAKLNIEQPGVYKYILNEEENIFIALPIASDEKNIYCVKDDKNSNWKNKDGFEVKDNSTTCDEFMGDIVNNYAKYYEIDLPDAGLLILSKDGKIQKGSTLEFKDTKCKYDSSEKKFTCK